MAGGGAEKSRCCVMFYINQRDDPIDALFVQLLARKMETADEGGCETLDEIFLDASRSRDKTVHHVILHQVPDGFTGTRRNQVRSVP